MSVIEADSTINETRLAGQFLCPIQICVVLAFLLIATSEIEAQNIVFNGDFEQPRITAGGFRTYVEGETFPGWVVDSGEIDIVRENMPNWGPSQTLDLNGNVPGAIQQALLTQPNLVYRLTFNFRVNHFNSTPPDEVLTAEVLWNNDTRVEWSRPWISFFPPPYETMQIDVIGTGNDQLTFRSLSGGTGSFILDNVSVTAVPEPSTLALTLIAPVLLLIRKQRQWWGRRGQLLALAFAQLASTQNLPSSSSSQTAQRSVLVKRTDLTADENETDELCTRATTLIKAKPLRPGGTSAPPRP